MSEPKAKWLRPLAVNSAVVGLNGVVAELLRHLLTSSGEAPDVANMLRQFIIGFSVVSPLATSWHPFAERSFSTVLGKTVAEQLLFAPVINNAYMASQGLLEGRKCKEVAEMLRSKFLEVWKGNIAFWVPVCIVQYRFVPVRLRVLFSSLMAILWKVYLIRKGGKQPVVKQAAIVETPCESNEAEQKVAEPEPEAPVLTEPSPLESPVKEVVAVAELPVKGKEAAFFGGKWMLADVEGDFDGFLQELGTSWMKRKVFRTVEYGKGRVKMEVEQDGDNFTLTNITTMTTVMTFTVGKGKQQVTSMEGQPIMMLPKWAEEGQVLESEMFDLEGKAMPRRKMYFRGEVLIVDLISVKGVLARRCYRKE